MTPLSADERARRAEERAAKGKADREAYIKKLVDGWPPLTDAQIDRIAILLRPDSVLSRGPRVPSAYELAERKKMQDREDALRAAKKAADAMTACDVCNLQPDVHRIRQANSIDMHHWQPGRAEKLLKRGANIAQKALEA